MHHHVHMTNVVLGAGAMGCAATYHLAKRGERVLLVEQFALGHDRGSSHGAARITRHSYADPRYARLMPEAFRAWRALEAVAGQALYIRTGGVSVSPEDVDYVTQVAASLESIGVPHRRMSGRAWNTIHPAFALPATDDVVFEPDAGMVLAARALAVEVELARQFGGEATLVYDNCPVRRIDLDADRPTLLTDTLRITADRLIVTAGTWVTKLFPSVAATLRPTRQQVLYFAPEDLASFQVGRFPVFIFKGREDDDAFYGMPDVLGAGVKAARHAGPVCDPDHFSREVEDSYRDVVRRFLHRFVPALAEAPIRATEICLYTVAPGDEFLVGPWPGRPDVIVASPCSGHGFKFSCLIGRILADLAVEGRTDIDLGPWSPARVL